MSFKVLEDKVKKSISLNRVNNVYTDQKLEKALKKLETGVMIKDVAI